MLRRDTVILYHCWCERSQGSGTPRLTRQAENAFRERVELNLRCAAINRFRPASQENLLQPVEFVTVPDELAARAFGPHGGLPHPDMGTARENLADRRLRDRIDPVAFDSRHQPERVPFHDPRVGPGPYEIAAENRVRAPAASPC